MNPAVIFLPSRIVSLVSVSWTMRAITPSSKSRVIQSSWPSGPATNPSTVICTCSLSFRIVAMSEQPVRWSHVCVESAIPKSTSRVPALAERFGGATEERRALRRNRDGLRDRSIVRCADRDSACPRGLPSDIELQRGWLARGDRDGGDRYPVLDEFDVVVYGERERLGDGARTRVAVRAHGRITGRNRERHGLRRDAWEAGRRIGRTHLDDPDVARVEDAADLRHLDCRPPDHDHRARVRMTVRLS